MNVQRLLITGANGFVGNVLCAEGVARGYAVRGATRTVPGFPLGASSVGVENITVGEISANTDWHNAILNCDVVIHLAARVHVMREGWTAVAG